MKLNFRKRVSDHYVVGLLGVLGGVVLLPSCGDKEKEKQEVTTVEAPKQELVVATPSQRAEKLGLLSLVPAQAEGLVVCYDLPRLISSIEQSNTVAAYNGELDVLKEDGDVEAVDVEVTADAGALVDGDEVVTEEIEADVTISGQCPVKQAVLASGPAKVDVINAFTADYPKLSKLTTYTRKQMVNQWMGGEKANSEEDQKKMLMELGKELSKFELLKLIDFTPGEGMAPILVMADLTPDAVNDVKKYVNQGMGGAVALGNGIVSPYSVKVGDLEFSGICVDGPMLSQFIKSASTSLPPEIDPAFPGMLADNVAKGKFYIVTAFKDNVLIVSACTNPEKQLVLPAKPEDSILGSKEFDFADQYLDKQPAFAAYMTPRICEAWLKYCVVNHESERAGMVDILNDVKDSGKADKVLCDKTAVEVTNFYNSYIDVVKKWDVSKSMTLYSWYDKGLMMEITNGDMNVYDWNNPAVHTAICDMPDAAFTYSFSIAKDYSDEMVKIYESLGKAAWYAAGTAYSSPLCTPEVKMYYEKMQLVQPELAKIWEEVKGLVPAFGQECALAIDFNGVVPECKDGSCNIPESVVKNGCLPRVAGVHSIKDRAKLGSAWDSILVEMNDGAAKLSEGKWKLGTPLSEEKDGYTSYWYDCPKLPGYDMPAVTLNDKTYVEGTSKAFNYQVAAMAKPSASVSPAVWGPLGLYMKLNTEPLAKAAAKWKTALPDKEQAAKIADVMEGFSRDIKAVNCTVSKEREKMYTRLHIEAR